MHYNHDNTGGNNYKCISVAVVGLLPKKHSARNGSNLDSLTDHFAIAESFITDMTDVTGLLMKDIDTQIVSGNLGIVKTY